MTNRRDFLRNTALGAAAIAAGTKWSDVLFSYPLGKPVGLQLYTLRDDLAKDVPGILKKVAEIGYKEAEVYDFYGKSAAEFAKLLKDNGLVAPSGHYMTHHIKSNWQKHIDDAKTVGMKYMVNAILEPNERRSFDDYKKLAELFNKAGEQTLKTGIHFCYHNHNFEFKKYGETTAFDYLLQALDPKLVNFEMDCFWVTHAGHTPVAYLEKHPGRFPLLHIKDLKDTPPPSTELDDRRGLFAEVGHGSIDWKPIFAAAPKGGMQHYYVEQDYCERPALESVKMSFEYLKNLKV
jgi:sugar phosphate isomerase/epimerase